MEGRRQENTCTNARHILNDLRLNQVERMATAFQLNTNIIQREKRTSIVEGKLGNEEETGCWLGIHHRMEEMK